MSKAKNSQSDWASQGSTAQALTIAERAISYSGISLVITATTAEASTLRTAISFFLQDSNIETKVFPDWETLPYDIFSPHQDIISDRIQILSELPTLTQAVLVLPLPSLLHQLPPTDFLASRLFDYQVDETLDRDKLHNQLTRAGYHRVETVYEHGEYAFRGSIIDIFPMGEKAPFRIDLLDNDIESLRIFDPESQRTLSSVERLRLLPAREFPLDKEGINQFLNHWHDHFDPSTTNCPVYKDVKQGIAPQGIEYYLSLFFDHTANLFDYLPEQTQVFMQGDIYSTANTLWQDINRRYTEYGVDPERPLLAPKEIFITVEDLFSEFKQLNIIHKEQNASVTPEEIKSGIPDISVNSKQNNPLEQLEKFILDIPADTSILFCAESAGRKEALTELVAANNIKPQPYDSWQDFRSSGETMGICIYPIDQGFYSKQRNICLITEGELFGQQVLQRRRRSTVSESPDYIFKSLAELKIGAPVVHLDHGVGRYNGLILLSVDGSEQEFLTLIYADDAKLYVPVASLHMISRFSGSGDETIAPLHRLGSDKWDKAKKKAAEKVRDTAAELLDIYSRRAARKGFSCEDNEEEYRQFCSQFPFEETADQQTTIDAVRKDLLSPQPMDRLVCGDVGFGKTEVAMRAAFTVVSSNKQVVILVPTTLLAHQHLDNFRDRFANWPIQVEELSRFKTAKEQQQVINEVEAGKVDILISTHKLLHANIDFSRLGLMIIDEEHRFGVRQKEQLKALRSSVDMLTMTATPIPRTLNMSMHSIRDLSIIATPPAKRLSVKTFIRKKESRVAKEAILREILRGGQVYYLHNDVKSIQRAADELVELVPEARINIAHGQMRERELEKIMSDFYHQRFNVLVCSTIIETGIDIPSANTIIIERADKFGLAQLHQLRGRVGRSHHQAYAYLMTHPEKKLTTDATKRLEAIAAAENLGSGFTLATNDLEIRGAGELLGEEQSGHIQSIGFTLYLEMLDQAVEAIQSGESPNKAINFDQGIEVNLHIPALIPSDYLPDVNMRLTFYKRLANCQDKQQLHELQVEMIDRFGLLPEAVKALFQIAEIRQIGEHIGLKKIEAGPTSGRLKFLQNTKVEPISIIKLVQQNPNKYKLLNNDQLSFTMPMGNPELRLSSVYAMLSSLTETL
ncbi:MAG: transcription-repair coupling factor [Cellvibrionales bacterium TMED47]|nr:transcription-repair coupling factor [Porticoccaceae bacterium]RPG85459.1 MAG: transcription-repair coupling factor [Cellvibrionales bacterium TMED47]